MGNQRPDTILATCQGLPPLVALIRKPAGFPASKPKVAVKWAYLTGLKILGTGWVSVPVTVAGNRYLVLLTVLDFHSFLSPLRLNTQMEVLCAGTQPLPSGHRHRKT